MGNIILSSSPDEQKFELQKTINSQNGWDGKHFS